jgi:hypothetical protein
MSGTGTIISKGPSLADWRFAQTAPEQRLARVEHFSVTRLNPDGREIEFLISIREYITPRDPNL